MPGTGSRAEGRRHDLPRRARVEGRSRAPGSRQGSVRQCVQAERPAAQKGALPKPEALPLIASSAWQASTSFCPCRRCRLEPLGSSASDCSSSVPSMFSPGRCASFHVPTASLRLSHFSGSHSFKLTRAQNTIPARSQRSRPRSLAWSPSKEITRYCDRRVRLRASSRW
jgi:hypothetical protein